MSTSREKILGRIQSALTPLQARAAYPEFPDNIASLRGTEAAADLWTAFKVRTQLVNGLAVDSVGDLAVWLREKALARGYCDPTLLPLIRSALGSLFTLETDFDRTRVDEYQFGITRAAGAIAETGSIILTDASTSNRLGALAPWVHVAVVPSDRIYPDVSSAIKVFGNDPNIIWCTGPSKTADVEGILIQGVHGPGVQVAVLELVDSRA
jgi:L-lactate dehydrogenase complex protein LldG